MFDVHNVCNSTVVAEKISQLFPLADVNSGCWGGKKGMELSRYTATLPLLGGIWLDEIRGKRGGRRKKTRFPVEQMFADGLVLVT